MKDYRWVVIFSCIAAAVWLETPATAQPANPVSSAPSAISGPADGFVLPPLEKLSQTRLRPLFSPGRRAPVAIAAPLPPVLPPIAATPVAATTPSDVLVLTGVALGPDARVAVVHNRRTNEVSRLQRGDKIGDWSVMEIEARSVLLRKGTQNLKLELFPEPEGKR
jgi:hypothetical protein